MTDEERGIEQEDVDEVQSPLVEDKTIELPTDVQSPLTDLPEQFVHRNEPDKATKDILSDIESRALCGMPLEFVWKKGPWKGKAVRVFCAEPLCVDTGYCTGPRFVPSEPQYTTHDTQDPFRRQREMEPEEVIAAARWGAVKATGKDDPRSDETIARYSGTVIQRMRGRLRAPGDWGA